MSLPLVYPHDIEARLGFDQLRQRLEGFCLCSLGAKRVAAMSFSNSYEHVLQALQQVVELRALMVQSETFPTSHFYDLTGWFDTVAIEGAFLEERVLYQFRQSLETVVAIKGLMTKYGEGKPALKALQDAVEVPRDLLKTLHTTLDEEGRVKDNASDELAHVRKRLREEHGRVRKLVEQIFRQAAASGYLPDGMAPTVREGRLVIPVLAEHKRKIRGFIVDESATGQTIFLEPAEALEANNEIRDLQLAERREVIKVLKLLTAKLRQSLPAMASAFDFLAEIDFVRAKVKLATELDAALPNLQPGPALVWQSARHPLLYLSLRGKRPVVPLNIDLLETNRFLLISGPNAGGKSVCLKTVGLVQYMLQCGLLVPMDEHSVCGIFDQLFIDIGDQQSIENDLSTYSSHLSNMNHFVRHAGAQTMVLLDELGAGTDPNFGGGIAQAVLEQLVQQQAWGVATTHYYNLKVFAGNTAGIRNGAMLFDSQKLEPRFVLEMGKPGSSFALEIARKIGLKPDALARAEAIIGKDLTGLETLMKSVADEKQAIARRSAELAKREEELRQQLAHYQKLSAELEARKKEIIDKAKHEASFLLKETNREIEKTIRHIRENKAERRETTKVRESLKSLAERVKPANPNVSEKKVVLKVGDTVRLVGQEVSGTILELKGATAIVQFGLIRSTVKTGQLVRSDLVQSQADPSRPRNSFDRHQRQANFSPLLDVRGKRVEEVVPLLHQFLDDALLLGQSDIRILHGKGGGVLRKVVREELKKTGHVASVADEHIERGGDGITVVVLK